MIMSIFPMNHARMEHSQVTRSTSMGEDMIHQYVLACVERCMFGSKKWIYAFCGMVYLKIPLLKKNR